MLLLPFEGAAAVVVYDQPASAGGGLFQSSWYATNEQGSDADQYVWDDFTLSSTLAITTIHWRGGYDPGKFGYGGPVTDFSVAIYATVAGIQPDVTHPPLVRYQTGGNAGQSPAGTVGGVTMYDYTFTLPTAFQAAAGTKYWVQVEAYQNGYPPDWGVAAGTGGDASHFLQFVNYAGGNAYAAIGGDTAFTLLGPVAQNDTPTPTMTPAPPTPTPTPTLGLCTGDCDHSSSVTVDELVRGARIALGMTTLDQCPEFDCNGNGHVSVDCVLRAVNAALGGCGPR